MLKTITKTKKLRLDELIKYVWDNAIYPSHFENDAGFKIHFDSIAGIKLDNDYVHSDATVFTVEVEEKITEDIMFNTLVSTYIQLGGGDIFIDVYSNHSIKDIIETDKIHGIETERIYALIDDELQLIYKRSSDEYV